VVVVTKATAVAVRCYRDVGMLGRVYKAVT